MQMADSFFFVLLLFGRLFLAMKMLLLLGVFVSSLISILAKVGAQPIHREWANRNVKQLLTVERADIHYHLLFPHAYSFLEHGCRF